MRKMMVLCVALAMVGCTDASFDKVTSYGSRASVKCYSGGVLIYEGTSTGKLLETQDSDGYNLRDSVTKDLVQVNGDCVVVYLD